MELDSKAGIVCGSCRQEGASVLKSIAEDDCLVNQVYQALLKTGPVTFQHLEITENHGLIILNGSVTTYYLKQLAQHVAMEVDGVRQLDNRLDVKRICSSKFAGAKEAASSLNPPQEFRFALTVNAEECPLSNLKEFSHDNDVTLSCLTRHPVLVAEEPD